MFKSRLYPRYQWLKQTVFNRIKELGVLQPRRGCRAGANQRQRTMFGGGNNSVGQCTIVNQDTAVQDVNNKYLPCDSQLWTIPTMISKRCD